MSQAPDLAIKAKPQSGGLSAGERRPWIRRLLGEAGAAFAINISGVGVGFLTHLVLARVLGAESYGVFTYVFSWLSVLVLVTTAGFPTALLRYVAVYYQDGAWDRLRGIIRFGTWVSLIGAGVTGALVAALVAVYWNTADRELIETVLLALAVLPLLGLLRLYASVLRAFGHLVSALVPDILLRETVIVILVGIAGLGLGITFNAPRAMTAVLAGVALGLAISIWAMHQVRPVTLDRAKFEILGREWLSAGLSMLVLSGTQLLLRRIDILLIGALIDMKTAGIYAVASRISELVLYPMIAVSTAFGPQIAQLHARQQHGRLQRTIDVTGLWAVLMSFIIVVPLIIFSSEMLTLFGQEFVTGRDTLRILLLGQLGCALTGSATLVMTMTGQQYQAARILMSVAIVAPMIAAILILHLGMEGAALATVLTALGWRTLFSWMTLKQLNIAPGVFGFLRAVRRAATEMDAGPPTDRECGNPALKRSATSD